jgi:hypothetical protein
MKSITMFSKTLLLCVLLVGAAGALALDEETWIRTYTGGYGHGVHPTPDGGAIMAGTYGAGFACCEPWLLKLRTDGSVDWQVTYQASGLWGANNLQPTSDGGYVMAAEGNDMQVLKVDGNGVLQWVKNYGEGGYTLGQVVVTSDDNYLVIGPTDLLDDGYHTNARAIKLDQDGNVIWQKVFGLYGVSEFFSSATNAYNGNHILAGMNRGDYWVMELDSSGNVVWQYSYGGTREDTGLVVTRVQDKYYMVVGASDSFAEGGLRNWWALLLDESGEIVEQLTLGGPDAEDPHTAISTSDGGFMIGGGSGSFGAGRGDLWLVKFDPRLQVEWQKAYGTRWRTEHAWQIQELPTGYAVIGDSYAWPDRYDIWLMTLDREGRIQHGDCGSVTDTDATPARTRARARSVHVPIHDTEIIPRDLKTMTTPVTWPVENCSPGEED